MKSDAENLESKRRKFPKGERDGSIHFNPPREHDLKNVFPDETAADGESNTSAGSTENSEDESLLAPLSKEQLRDLLNHFLDQLIASKPPARDSEGGMS